ncbi:MAG: amidophosphoribosyltransferase [Eubacteriales bacterium]
MGGFFGCAKRSDAISDVFFGTDYHSHLGTRCGGIAAYSPELGLQRQIHSIANSPFRTKFENIFEQLCGNSSIGCISDSDPQPLLIRSNLGTYAICTVANINNTEELLCEVMASSGHINAMTGGAVNSTELIAAVINLKASFVEGIKYAQSRVDGSATILILTDEGKIIAARDKVGRLPVELGVSEDGYCVAFEDFAYKKLGYSDLRELGPGEIVEITADGVTVLAEPGTEMKICAFLWSYFGYPTSNYEGTNVECMRCKNGALMARREEAEGRSADVDYVCGVPDSGTPHAIGYANESHIPFARPFIKYTPTWPRSFMPPSQVSREKIAKMKLVPVGDLILGKKLLFVDDSIVRGTQLKETVEFLYDNGAEAVHMRSACPPIMYGCRYLHFSPSTSDNELIARRIIIELEGEEGLNYLDEYSDGSTERGRALRDALCRKFNFASLEYQTLEGIVEAIGIDESKLCTYCWNGKR